MAEFLVANMRPDDRREIFDLRTSQSDEDLIADMIRFRALVGLVDGVPVSVIGTTPVNSAPWIAHVWGFGTPAWQTGWRELHFFITRYYRPALHESGYQRGVCLSAAWHTAAHRWLRACGARPGLPISGLSHSGAEYIPFEWRAEDLRHGR